MHDQHPPQPGEKVCPNCGSARVHRSHRRGFYERVLLPLLGRRPFRCADCEHRFISFRRAHLHHRRDQGQEAPRLD